MGRLKTTQEKERLMAIKQAKREQDQIKEGDKVLEKIKTMRENPGRVVDFHNGEKITVRRSIPQKIG